jgi:hypothetical protein
LLDVKGNGSELLPEKRLLFGIVEAHCGQTRDGSRDTIKNLDASAAFQRKLINCQRVAAILRLADELAEGPQRSSLFMQKNYPPDQNSQVFHDYAKHHTSLY